MLNTTFTPYPKAFTHRFGNTQTPTATVITEQEHFFSLLETLVKKEHYDCHHSVRINNTADPQLLGQLEKALPFLEKPENWQPIMTSEQHTSISAVFTDFIKNLKEYNADSIPSQAPFWDHCRAVLKNSRP
jgi:hypothetical protein